jgi:hypothetical protein
MFLGVRRWDFLFYQLPTTNIVHKKKTKDYQEMR